MSRKICVPAGLTMILALSLSAMQAEAEVSSGSARLEETRAPSQWWFCRPAENIRELDAAGGGRYLSSRGTRHHEAYDYLVNPGDLIVSPVDGKIDRIGFPYPGNRQLMFVQIIGRNGVVARVMYVASSLPKGTNVSAGQFLGIAQDVRTQYPSANGMRAHIHVDVSINGQRVDFEKDRRFKRGC